MNPTYPGAATASDTRRLLRAFPAKPLLLASGRGHLVVAPDGTEYVDLGGASQGVGNFGHGHPRIVAAMQEQASRLVYASNTIPSPVRGAFLDRLHQLLPDHLDRTFLANSGTEAMECALKLAAAKTGRSRFVAMRGSFHGRTLAALSVTHRPQYRQPFQALLPQADFVPPNDVAALEAAVTSDIAAVVLEPVQGEGGLTVLSAEYLRAAQRIAHDAGAQLVVDEVQTGLGRTGTDLAIEQSGIRPDALTLGKSLAGGLPIGTCSITAELAAALPPGGHGNTFGGSPMVCAAGTAALEVLREERLAERARVEGERVLAALRALTSPLVREVRGQGLMFGLDLRVKAQGILDSLLAGRRLALSAGPTVVRFLPPLAIPREALDAAVLATSDALREATP